MTCTETLTATTMASLMAHRLSASSRSTLRVSKACSLQRMALSTSRQVRQVPGATAASNGAPKPSAQPDAGNPKTVGEKTSQMLETPLPNASANDGATDWSRSYHGLSTEAFPPEVADVLLAPVDPLDVEMKPGTSTFISKHPFICLYWALS